MLLKEFAIKTEAQMFCYISLGDRALKLYFWAPYLKEKRGRGEEMKI